MLIVHEAYIWHTPLLGSRGTGDAGKAGALRGYSACDAFASFGSGGCGRLARKFYVLDAS